MFTLNNNFKFYKNYFLKNYIPLFSKREKNYISVENEFLILKNKIQQQKKDIIIFFNNKKSHPRWRFSSYDTIPPLPPKAVIFRKKGKKISLGLKIINGKEFVGYISLQGNDMGTMYYRKNKKILNSNGNYFILVDDNYEIEKDIKSSITKKKFFYKIKKFITQEDKDLITHITKVKFQYLIRDLKKTDKDLWLKISSPIRWIDTKLNKKGLHLLRCLLTQRIYENKISKKTKEGELRNFFKDGYILLPFEKINKKLIKKILTKISTYKSNMLSDIKWKKSVVKHLKKDNQNDVHIDSFHNTFKVWVYPKNINKTLGPLHIIPGTHKNDIKKLKWLFKISNSKIGYKEPSFRLTNNNMKIFPKLVPILPIKNKKTIIFVNTYAFHKRGKIKHNLKRITYRIAGDNDGGVKRYNPFY